MDDLFSEPAYEWRAFHIQVQRAALHMFIEGEFPKVITKDTMEMVDMVKKLVTPAVVAYLGQVMFSSERIEFDKIASLEDQYFRHMASQKAIVLKGLEDKSKKDAQYLIDQAKNLIKGDDNEQQD